MTAPSSEPSPIRVTRPFPNATVKVISSQYGSSRENPADKIPLLEQWVTMQRTQTILRGHRSGLAYLRALLEKAKTEMASDG